ncbi:MAG: hypothetical protein PHX61_02750 [Alphaproteobacteria bacterium]|nr:hypothetical protein [Alphaproteobacteria bacterium]
MSSLLVVKRGGRKERIKKIDGIFLFSKGSKEKSHFQIFPCGLIGVLLLDIFSFILENSLLIVGTLQKTEGIIKNDPSSNECENYE